MRLCLVRPAGAEFMTPKQIREYRFAATFLPSLWAFAYPSSGRGLTWLRRRCVVLWARLFGLAVSLRDI